MKLLALNLPQFHAIPENDEWWGTGFTEWDNVRRARPLYEGHLQPQVPLGGYYYDLSKKEDVLRQCSLAREYGLAGFVYYHYWFNGKLLLERPCEILRDSPEADVEYCFCWANEPWARTWDGKPGDVLMPQTFGGESDWEAHIVYLERFFSDPRYIKVDGCPMLYVYSPSQIPDFDRMADYWDTRLRELGYPGIYLVEFISTKNPEAASSHSRAVMEFEPLCTARFGISNVAKAKRLLAKKTGNTDFLDYDAIWRKILKKGRSYGGRSVQKSAFVGWDNSPRKGVASTIIRGSTPDKFGRYMTELLLQSRDDCHDDFLVINAWNEWGEGAMLEPTEAFGYSYLEALRDSLALYERRDGNEL